MTYRVCFNNRVGHHARKIPETLKMKIENAVNIISEQQQSIDILKINLSKRERNLRSKIYNLIFLIK